MLKIFWCPWFWAIPHTPWVWCGGFDEKVKGSIFFIMEVQVWYSGRKKQYFHLAFLFKCFKRSMFSAFSTYHMITWFYCMLVFFSCFFVDEVGRKTTKRRSSPSEKTVDSVRVVASKEHPVPGGAGLGKSSLKFDTQKWWRFSFAEQLATYVADLKPFRLTTI